MQPILINITLEADGSLISTEQNSVTIRFPEISEVTISFIEQI